MLIIQTNFTKSLRVVHLMKNRKNNKMDYQLHNLMG